MGHEGGPCSLERGRGKRRLDTRALPPPGQACSVEQGQKGDQWVSRRVGAREPSTRYPGPAYGGPAPWGCVLTVAWTRIQRPGNPEGPSPWGCQSLIGEKCTDGTRWSL